MKRKVISIVPKIWGREEWITNGEYCGKKLYLNKGYRCSIHLHNVKDEVFYVESGRVYFDLGTSSCILESGQAIHVPRQTKHRFRGLEDSVIFEFSTHHEDQDTVRFTKSGK